MAPLFFDQILVPVKDPSLLFQIKQEQALRRREKPETRCFLPGNGMCEDAPLCLIPL